MNLNDQITWKALQIKSQRHPFTGDVLYPFYFRTGETIEGILYLEQDLALSASGQSDDLDGVDSEIPESYMKSLCLATESIARKTSRIVLLTSIPTYLTVREVFTFIWTNVPTDDETEPESDFHPSFDHSPNPGSAHLTGFGTETNDGISEAPSAMSTLRDGEPRSPIFEEACILRGHEPDTYSMLISTSSTLHSQRICESLKSLPIDGIDFTKLAFTLPVTAILQRTAISPSPSALSLRLSKLTVPAPAPSFPIWYFHALSKTLGRIRNALESDSVPRPDRPKVVPATATSVAGVQPDDTNESPVLAVLPATRSTSVNSPRLQPAQRSHRQQPCPQLLHTTSLNDAIPSLAMLQSPTNCFGQANQSLEDGRDDDYSATRARVVALGLSPALISSALTPKAAQDLETEPSIHRQPQRQLLTPPTFVSNRTSSSTASTTSASSAVAVGHSSTSSRRLSQYTARASTPSYAAIVPDEQPPSMVIMPPSAAQPQVEESIATTSTATPLHYLSALAVAAARQRESHSPILSVGKPSHAGMNDASNSTPSMSTTMVLPLKHLMTDASGDSPVPSSKRVSPIMVPPPSTAVPSVQNVLDTIVASNSQWSREQCLGAVCPICLERLYESPSHYFAASCYQGSESSDCNPPACAAADQRPVLTVFCGHTFHFECLSHWSSSACPLCRRALLPASAEPRCAECASQRALWLCLLCGHVGCGRYSGSHAAHHFHQTGHALAMDFTKPTRVWDYVADSFVSRVLAVKGGSELVAVEADDEGDSALSTERTTVAVAEAAEVVAAVAATDGVEQLDLSPDTFETPHKLSKTLARQLSGGVQPSSTPGTKTLNTSGIILTPGAASSSQQGKPPLDLTTETKFSGEQSLAREIESRLGRVSGSHNVPDGLRAWIRDYWTDGVVTASRSNHATEENNQIDPSVLQAVWATSLKLESVVKEYNQLLTTQMISQRSYFEAYLTHAHERHLSAIAASKEELAQTLARVASEEAALALAREDLKQAQEKETMASQRLEAAQSEERLLRDQLKGAADDVAEAARLADTAEHDALRVLTAVSQEKDAEIKALEEMLTDIRFSLRAQRMVRKSHLRDDIVEGRIMYP